MVWMAMLLVFLLTMVAFAVDLSYMTVVATQLQNAADAAALSGVIELSQGNSAVVAEVQGVALENQAAGNPVNIDASDVEFGHFDLTARTFDTSSANLNAIRVTARVWNRAAMPCCRSRYVRAAAPSAARCRGRPRKRSPPSTTKACLPA